MIRACGRPPPKGVVCSSFPRSGLVEGYDGRACVANSTGLLFSFSSAFARQRPAVAAWRKFAKGAQGPVAQWIRHRPTEPGIAGSSPAGVICASHPLHARPAWRLPRVFWSCGKSAGDVSATNRSHGPCGLMDKALVFGTKDCRLESCQGQHISLAHTRAV